MDKMTITEGLAELKLIDSKVKKKQDAVLGNLVRFEHIPDPFEKEGGSRSYVAKEIQSVGDLLKRHTKIRTAIAKANIESQVTINNETKSIYEWLAWKREISERETSFYRDIYAKTKSAVDQLAARPQFFNDQQTGQPAFAKQIVNIDYGTSLGKSEELSDTAAKLDGILSLKNATLTIEV